MERGRVTGDPVGCQCRPVRWYRYGHETMDDELGKVTLRSLTSAERSCPRRLAREHAELGGNKRANGRFRVTGQLVADIRLAHVDCVRPEPARLQPTADLTPEQQAQYRHLARWYCALFGDDAARVVDAGPYEWSTPRADLGVTLVGAPLLRCERGDGSVELRVLRFDTRRREASPTDSADVRFAVLRQPDLASRPFDIAVANLQVGEYQRWTAEIDWTDACSDWLRERVDAVRDRIADQRPIAGVECGSCIYIAGCGALR
jgi:hypothetical protein